MWSHSLFSMVQYLEKRLCMLYLKSLFNGNLSFHLSPPVDATTTNFLILNHAFYLTHPSSSRAIQQLTVSIFTTNSFLSMQGVHLRRASRQRIEPDRSNFSYKSHMTSLNQSDLFNFSYKSHMTVLNQSDPFNFSDKSSNVYEGVLQTLSREAG